MGVRKGYRRIQKAKLLIGKIELLFVGSVFCMVRDFSSLEPGKFCWHDVSKVTASIFMREVTSSYTLPGSRLKKARSKNIYVWVGSSVWWVNPRFIKLSQISTKNELHASGPFSLTPNPCFPLFKLKLIQKFPQRTFFALPGRPLLYWDNLVANQDTLYVARGSDIW